MATLLSLEFIVFILYISLYYYLNIYNFELYFKIPVLFFYFPCLRNCSTHDLLVVARNADHSITGVVQEYALVSEIGNINRQAFIFCRPRENVVYINRQLIMKYSMIIYIPAIKWRLSCTTLSWEQCRLYCLQTSGIEQFGMYKITTQAWEVPVFRISVLEVPYIICIYLGFVFLQLHSL